MLRTALSAALVMICGAAGFHRAMGQDGTPAEERAMAARAAPAAPDEPPPGRFMGFGAEWDPKFWTMGTFDLSPGWDEPVLNTEDDWNLVLKRMAWMRLPFVRMMMLDVWVTEGDGAFDWTTKHAQSLFRHLEACQQLGIAVILTDWGVMTWAKDPGFSSTSDPRYAEAIGEYLDYLINIKGFTAIKYFVLVNEPNFEDRDMQRWGEGVWNVAGALKLRGLDRQVTLMGPGAAFDDAWQRFAVDELSDTLGAYDVHRYPSRASVAAGEEEPYLGGLRDYILAHDPAGASKPFVITEAGMGDGMSTEASPSIEDYDYGVFMADLAVQAARAGVDGVSAWQLDDSTEAGFHWGMWGDKDTGLALRPWFYVWGLLSRTVPPGSKIVAADAGCPGVRMLAAEVPLAGRTGWTFCLVNRGDDAATVALAIPDGTAATLHRYVYSRCSAAADGDGFPLPLDDLLMEAGAVASIDCPASSVVLLTSVPR